MVGEGGDWGCENALGIATQVTSGWGRGFGEGIGEFEEELRGEEWNGGIKEWEYERIYHKVFALGRADL